MAKGKGIYKHRGILIFPYKDNWRITDYHKEFDTITEAKNYIDKRIGGTATKVIPKRLYSGEIVKVVEYHWGQFSGKNELPADELKDLEVLDEFDLLGFDLREEDRDLTFLAESIHIDRDDDGVGVKHAYGVDIEVFKRGIL